MKFFLLAFAAKLAMAQTPGIVGQWKTFDESTGAPKALVELYQDNDEFKGKLLETYDHPERTLCEKCDDEKHNKPLKGLEMVWGVKAKDKDEWGGGHILDPENGKTYKVKFALEDGGKKLRVRGFLGISLLGRTQVWQRK